MARILVVGADASIAQRRLLNDLVQRMRTDGHDAVLWARAAPGAAKSVREADALVAVLDGIPAAGTTAIAMAEAMDKPCLGLATRGQADALFAELTHLVEADDELAWFDALPSFYDRVRPFSGRLVRDRIPQLVKEAGHDVRFRSLSDDERPRFLKQKIWTEAKELAAADLANEKEEVADLLEALEAFLLARGFDRDDLRRIKEHKKKLRGGFERAFVVESTNGTADAGTRTSAGPAQPVPAGPPQASQEPTADRAVRHAPGAPAAAPTARPMTGFAVAQRAAQARPETGHVPSQPTERERPPGGVATGDEVDFEYTDAPGAAPPAAHVDDLAAGRDVRPKFFEI